MIVLGTLLGYYLARTYRLAGSGVSVSLFIIGLFALMDSLSLISTTIVVIAFASASGLLVVSSYFVLHRDPKVFLMFGFFILLIVEFDVLSIPWAFLFVYAGISLSISNAIDYSQTSVSLCKANADRYLREFLWAFSHIEIAVKRAFGSPIRVALLASYFAFEVIVILVVPYVINRLTNGIVGFETLVLAIVVLFVVSSEEYKRGLRHLQDPSGLHA